MQAATTNKGLMNRSNEIPADLIATNSKLSPRFPNVMIDDIKIDRGKANGIAVAVTYAVSFMILEISNPFPTKSSMYFQKNCITKMNRVMKKVAMNGPMKDLRMSLSSFFITGYWLQELK
jgi:hypothetical protein